MAFQRLRRVAHQVEQDAKQLIGIGVDGQPALDRADPHDRRVGCEPGRFAHLRDDGLEQDHAAIGCRLLGAAIGQRRLAKRDRALQRAHQFRRKPLHPGIGHAGELVRKQLRGGQQIAQIVVDLRHRKAKSGEPALLMLHRHQIALHDGQFTFCDADLVAALAGHDNPRRALWIFVETDQARGQAPHRPHEQIMQRQIDQSRGEHRNPERDREQIAGKPVHRLT